MSSCSSSALFPGPVVCFSRETNKIITLHVRNHNSQCPTPTPRTQTPTCKGDAALSTANEMPPVMGDVRLGRGFRKPQVYTKTRSQRGFLLLPNNAKPNFNPQRQRWRHEQRERNHHHDYIQIWSELRLHLRNLWEDKNISALPVFARAPTLLLHWGASLVGGIWNGGDTSWALPGPLSFTLSVPLCWLWLSIPIGTDPLAH